MEENKKMEFLLETEKFLESNLETLESRRRYYIDRLKTVRNMIDEYKGQNLEEPPQVVTHERSQ